VNLRKDHYHIQKKNLYQPFETGSFIPMKELVVNRAIFFPFCKGRKHCSFIFHMTTFAQTNQKNKNNSKKNEKLERQLLTMDLLARASMKNAASCDT
jgi:hypothetical protein